MSKNTSIALGEHFDSFVAEQLQSGRYASASEVLRAGLRLLEQQEAEYSTLRKLLDEDAVAGEVEYSVGDLIVGMDG